MPRRLSPSEPADFEFLRKLMPGGVVPRERLGSPTREMDRTRQRCKDRGWALYQGRGWIITDAGKQALSRVDAGGKAVA